MKYLLAVLLILPLRLLAQEPGDTLHLSDLVLEALRNNPEMKVYEYNRELMDARIGQSGVLPDPELTYMREDMPGFDWN
ncbi:MAG: TolC family protein, partial [bacterium]